MTRQIKGGADIVLTAPDEELLAMSLGNRSVRNPVTAADVPGRVLSPYLGYEAFLVRTALIRSDMFQRLVDQHVSVRDAGAAAALSQFVVTFEPGQFLIVAMDVRLNVVALHVTSNRNELAKDAIRIGALTNSGEVLIVERVDAMPSWTPERKDELLGLAREMRCGFVGLADYVFVGSIFRKYVSAYNAGVIDHIKSALRG